MEVRKGHMVIERDPRYRCGPELTSQYLVCKAVTSDLLLNNSRFKRQSSGYSTVSISIGKQKQMKRLSLIFLCERERILLIWFQSQGLLYSKYAVCSSIVCLLKLQKQLLN